MTDEELVASTKSLCEASEGFEPYGEWRKRIAQRMTAFVPSSVSPN